MDEYENLLTRIPSGCSRTKGVRAAIFADLLELGVTGPMMRAAGLKMDVRKDQPYSSYDKFDFEIPTRTENDVYARYRVRMEEMRQSARIVTQALEGMPEGPLAGRRAAVVLPDREKMKTQMEALIYHFKIVTEGFRVPAGEVYQVVESPRGEIRILHRERRHVASRIACSCARRASEICRRWAPCSKAGCIADSIAALGSMDFVLGDVDR